MDRYSGPRLKLFLVILGWAPILFLSLGAGIVILPMLRQGYPLVHSIHFNLMWAFQYSQQVFGGDLYPRWLESSFFGLGNPTFVFYPPLCMVAVLPFTALGWSAGSALVGSMLLATAVCGWGTYRVGCLLWPAPVAGAAALAAMAWPYFLVDVYERGAIGEVWAISLIPWVLWAGWRLVLAVQIGRGRYLAIVVLAGCYALLGLTHLPALLIWTLVWLGLPWIMARTGRELRLLGVWLYGGTGMGLLLASFFLLPAALDQRWVSIDLINGWEMYDPLQRFLLIWNEQGLQLSQREFDVHLVPYFWMALLLGLVSVAWMGLPERFRPQDPLARRGLLYLGLITLLACGMMTSLSGPLYQIAAPLHRIQFPWRWMVVTSSTVPLLLGYWLQAAFRFRQRLGQGIGVGLCLGLLAFSIALGLDRTSVSFSPTLIQQFDTLMAQRPPFPQEPQVDPERAEHFLGWHWAYPQGLAFVDAFEYRPLTASNNPVPPPQTYELAAWLQGSGPIQIRRWRYGERQIQVDPDPDQARLLALRTFAYPGWGVWRDGQTIPVQAAADGRLVIPIPPQATKISVIYQGTLAERGGTALTWLTLLGLLGVGYLRYRHSGQPTEDQPTSVA